MSLAEKINIDVKNALKAGDKKLLAVSRNVLSELKNLLIKENLERDISKITNAELVRTDRAQIMFDYLISKRFADTMTAMLSPIFKMSEQLQKERTAIKKQWAIRENMIDEVISNANIFHGHLVSVSDNGMPSIEGLASINELDQLN